MADKKTTTLAGIAGIIIGASASLAVPEKENSETKAYIHARNALTEKVMVQEKASMEEGELLGEMMAIAKDENITALKDSLKFTMKNKTIKPPQALFLYEIMTKEEKKEAFNKAKEKFISDDITSYDELLIFMEIINEKGINTSGEINIKEQIKNLEYE